MDYFMIGVMLSAFSAVIYYFEADIFQTVQTRTPPPLPRQHLWIVKVFSSNYNCDQYTYIDNITP